MQMVRKMYSQNIPVVGMQEKSLIVASELNRTELKAPRGWWDSFKTCCNISSDVSVVKVLV